MKTNKTVSKDIFEIIKNEIIDDLRILSNYVDNEIYKLYEKWNVRDRDEDEILSINWQKKINSLNYNNYLKYCDSSDFKYYDHDTKQTHACVLETIIKFYFRDKISKILKSLDKYCKKNITNENLTVYLSFNIDIMKYLKIEVYYVNDYMQNDVNYNHTQKQNISVTDIDKYDKIFNKKMLRDIKIYDLEKLLELE